MKIFLEPLPANISSSVDTFADDMNKLVKALVEIRLNVPNTAADIGAVATADYQTLVNRVSALETAIAALEAPNTASVPGAPTITGVVPGDTIATINFSTPTSNGSDILKYSVSSSTGKTVEGTSSPIVMTGLTNGTAVSFTVRAVNAIGNGPYSSSSIAVVPVAPAKPGAPTNVTASSTNGGAVISWSVPTSAGDAAISGYRVTVGTLPAQDVSSVTRTATFTGLTNGTNYTGNVVAINAYGAGVAATFNVTPANGLPDLIVTSVTANPSAPTAGSAVTFSATVKNQGSSATPDGIIHGVRFDVDGTTVNWSDNSTTSLAPGASRTYVANSGPAGTASWTATAGTHAVLATVNDLNRFNESSTTNNNLSVAITVTGVNTGGTTTNPGTGTTNPVAGVRTTSNSSVRRVREFTDSIGAGVHLAYTDTPYGNLAQVKTALEYTGITHVRDGWGSGRSSIVNYIKANMPYLKMTMLLDARDWGGSVGNVGSGTQPQAQYNAWQSEGTNDLIEILEGPNEWDLSGQATAAGQYFGNRLNLWKAAGKAIGTPSNADTNTKSKYDAWIPNIGGKVDYLISHCYPGGDSTMSDLILNTLNTTGRGLFNNLASTDPVPVVTTETGFAQGPAGSDPGKSIPDGPANAIENMKCYFELFKGLPGKMYGYRTYRYELVDEPGKGTDNPEGTFGMFDANWNPRPHATAVRNLMGMLKDDATNALSFTPSVLPGFSISGAGSQTRYFLMQKANGEWWVAIWEQVVNYDNQARAYRNPPRIVKSTATSNPANVTINWTGTKTATAYLPVSSAAAQKTATGTSLAVTSTFNPQLIRIA
jgi:hypothetical protein